MSNETPVVRSVKEIQEQLADLDKVKRVAENYGTPDFASELGMRSLRNHWRELLDELRAAKLLETKARADSGLERNRENRMRKSPVLSSIDIHSSVAVYVQIENQIQFAIASGRLKPGDQLPSVVELSERLDVNPNTVAKSYRDLEVMGLLYTRRGMGVFVNKNIEAKCREDCRRRIIGRLHEDVAEAKASGMIHKEIIDVVKASLAADASPYGETPASVAVLAKVKASGK
jgi:GntR family transcriptional regulator